MSDRRERELERKAAQGDATADQRLMCYRIQKLGIELPIDPNIFATITLPGVYAGQAVAEKDGMQHPCLKWHRGNMVEYYDLRSGWKIKSEMTHFVRSRQGGQTLAASAYRQGATDDHTVDAIAYAVQARRTPPRIGAAFQRIGDDIASQISELTGLDVSSRPIYDMSPLEDE